MTAAVDGKTKRSGMESREDFSNRGIHESRPSRAVVAMGLGIRSRSKVKSRNGTRSR